MKLQLHGHQLDNIPTAIPALSAQSSFVPLVTVVLLTMEKLKLDIGLQQHQYSDYAAVFDISKLSSWGH